MSKTYLPYEPDQQLLLPAALQEWLPDDHLAYFISDVVDQFDMSEVTARYERERRGGPPYHPRMMVKVLLYGYGLMQSGGLLLDGLRFPDRRQQDVQQAHLGGECEQGDEVSRVRLRSLPPAPQRPVVRLQTPELFPRG